MISISNTYLEALKLAVKGYSKRKIKKILKSNKPKI